MCFFVVFFWLLENGNVAKSMVICQFIAKTAQHSKLCGSPSPQERKRGTSFSRQKGLLSMKRERLGRSLPGGSPEVPKTSKPHLLLSWKWDLLKQGLGNKDPCSEPVQSTVRIPSITGFPRSQPISSNWLPIPIISSTWKLGRAGRESSHV